MSDEFQINAEPRTASGTNASRTLRRAGKVPAVLYGGGGEVVPLQFNANELKHHLEKEAFYSHILTLKLKDSEERVILRDLQRHPSRSLILHLDLLRVSEDQALRVNVPLHFINEDICIGVKQQGGVVSHLQTEIEIACLPKHLPEFIEVNIAELELGNSLHLSDVELPEGVEITALTHGEVTDNAIVSVNVPRVAIEEEPGVADAEAEGEEAAAAEAKEEGVDSSE